MPARRAVESGGSFGARRGTGGASGIGEARRTARREASRRGTYWGTRSSRRKREGFTGRPSTWTS